MSVSLRPSVLLIPVSSVLWAFFYLVASSCVADWSFLVDSSWKASAAFGFISCLIYIVLVRHLVFSRDPWTRSSYPTVTEFVKTLHYVFFRATGVGWQSDRGQIQLIMHTQVTAICDISHTKLLTCLCSVRHHRELPEQPAGLRLQAGPELGGLGERPAHRHHHLALGLGQAGARGLIMWNLFVENQYKTIQIIIISIIRRQVSAQLRS